MLKLTKAQLVQIIKEEAVKVKKEFLLRKEIESIDKQLNELNEVHAGGEMSPGPEGYHAGQRKPVFKMKGTHKLEEDDDELETVDSEEDETSTDIEPDTDVDMEVPSDDSTELTSDDDDVAISKEELMAALQDFGSQLNLTGVIDFDASSEVGVDVADTDNMDVDIDADVDADNMDVDIETGAEDETGMKPAGEIDGEEVSAQIGDGDSDTEETSSDEETIDECGEEMEEKENMPTQQEQRLNEEKNRWAKLAGIIKS